MTTPTTTAVDQVASVPWEVIIPVALALLGALGVTLRMLFKGVHKRIDGVEKTFEKRVDTATVTTDEKLDEKFQRLHELVIQSEERVGSYFLAHERLRDRWDEFLREYLKIDSTRGQKVDALFRVNDQVQKIVDALPRHVDSKIEEAFTHSLSELKLYIRELLAKERSDVK